MSEVDVLKFDTGGTDGSPARVVQRLADGRVVEHQGQPLQLGGALDPQTRLAQVTVGIASPFDSEGASLPLLPGAYVEVIFEGLLASQVIRLPRATVYSGNTVWVASNGILKRREVEITGGDAESVLIARGIQAGDAIVTTALSLPVEGTPVSVIGDKL